MKSHFRVCNYCEAMCGVEVIHDPQAPSDAEKIRVLPDKNDPFSRGSMCPKAAALGPLHFDPSKLRYPVRKLDGCWQRISWDEAFAIVADKLTGIREKYGANAIATYLGNPIVHNLGMMVFIKAFTRAIGSKNVFSATSMDQLPHHFAAHYMFGHTLRIPVPDIDRSDFMILMGANPLASNGSIMSSAGVTGRLREIEKRGGKFVVLDPRRTETARIASEHHFIKPETDLFFLLAFLHIMFRDHKLRPGRLQAHLHGAETLARLVSRFSPAEVAPITGIKAEEIERLVAEFLHHERAVLYGRMGVSTQAHGGLCHWLIATINVLSGNFDSPGGMMFPSPAIEMVPDGVQRQLFGRWRSRVRGAREFAGELPVSTMAEEFLTPGEGQVKAFVTVCGNPLLSSPGGNRLDGALEAIEFMVSIDNFINETTCHADLILPTPSGLEIDHYDLIFNAFAVSNNAKFSEALFPPGKDRPQDWQVLKELARRISPTGLSRKDRWTTPRRVVKWGLLMGRYGKLSSPKRWFNGLSLRKLIRSKHGISLGPHQPRVPQCLRTADRKIHLAAPVFLDRLAEITQQEYPALLQAARQAREKSRFVYIGRRNVSTNNTWMHQVKILSRSKQARCTVMINPRDAEALDIYCDEVVRVRSRVGEITLPAEITTAMMSGVVSIPHGFGHNKPGTRVPIADANPGVSVNDITDYMRLDKLTGNAAFSGLEVELEKVSRRVQAPRRSGKPLTILYASQSGNAEMVAMDLAKAAGAHGLLGGVLSMGEVEAKDLGARERILLVVSTFGDGDMPDNAESLWNEVCAANAPRLEGTSFAVLALGDRSYEHFCQAGKQWDQRMAALGAHQVTELIECDVDYADRADQWVEQVLPLISVRGDQRIVREAPARNRALVRSHHNRRNPMRATLIEKRPLSSGATHARTMHYTLALNAEHETWEAGDSIYLIPKNRPQLVAQLIECCGFDGDEVFPDRGRCVRDLLLEELEIRLPSQDSLRMIARYYPNSPVSLLADQPATLGEYLWGKDLLELSRLHPVLKNHWEEWFATLRPITARAYSIASSPKTNSEHLDLTVATLRYPIGERTLYGAASNWLLESLREGDEIPCYFLPNKHFSVPRNPDTPIIMIGPGTGVAPFRGFLQERSCVGASGDNWLFFGGRERARDFLYQQEFQAMQRSGLLTRLDVAFSRDQDEKIYVQHRMQENAVELFSWLQRGACVFVCGDAAHMAGDVEQAWLEIIRQQGEMDVQQATEYLENLKREKRYLTDVY